VSTLAPVHSVHFYDNHQALIDRLTGVVYSGLLVGNSVLMVCTEEHRQKLLQALERLQIDVRDYARKDRFAICDASEMLAMFMVEGLPDASRFAASVGKLVLDAKKAARSNDHGLTVFGEMVAVLWEAGNKAGAIALEKLWNDSMREQVFHLHCAYPEWLFADDVGEMRQICELHSHVLETTATA
jgi:KaiC/GvpD/RAD55 family RecA-like ATPase